MTLFGIPITFKWIHGVSKNDPIIPFNPSNLKLGRLPYKHDPRTLRFAKYVTDAIPSAPAVVDYGDKVKSWGMLANDQTGDCTCAGILHAIMLWLSQNNMIYRPSDGEAISLYEKLCGYVPGKPETDGGGVELDIMKAWRREPIAGCTLLGYALVDPTNWEHVKLAHWLAGSLYMGVSLPISAQSEKLWASTDDTPGGWGGHCMVTSAYRDTAGLFGLTSNRRITAITWGATQDMTPAWLAKYCDELWIPITTAWFGKEGKAPNGFDLAQLKADIAAVSSNQIN